MSHKIIKELLNSLAMLEREINETRNTLSETDPDSRDILQRLSCYEEVLRKQKILAVSLEVYLAEENWDQVRRHIELIRGSSLLIQLDSQAIISGMVPNVSREETLKFCA